MTAKDVYSTALTLLGYTDSPEFQRRAIPICNKVYLDLFRITKPSEEFIPLRALNDRINLSEKVIISVMTSGVAEMLALGEGDGELQQYFALDYDRAKARLNITDTVKDVIP